MNEYKIIHYEQKHDNRSPLLIEDIQATFGLSNRYYTKSLSKKTKVCEIRFSTDYMTSMEEFKDYINDMSVDVYGPYKNMFLHFLLEKQQEVEELFSIKTLYETLTVSEFNKLPYLKEISVSGWRFKLSFTNYVKETTTGIFNKKTELSTLNVVRAPEANLTIQYIVNDDEFVDYRNYAIVSDYKECNTRITSWSIGWSTEVISESKEDALEKFKFTLNRHRNSLTSMKEYSEKCIKEYDEKFVKLDEIEKSVLEQYDRTGTT